MKTRNLLLALGCAAALTACTENDEPNVAPAPAKNVVTLSVEVNEPADTRVSYEKDGTTYKFAWSKNDMLRVFYKDGSNNEVYADFTIVENSIVGKKADFTSADFPEKFTGDVTIVYSGTGLTFVDADGNGMHNDLMLTGYYGQTTSVAADLADRTLLYSKAVVTEEGKLPDVTLNHALSYLLLKKGLQVTQAGLNVGEGDTELLLEVGTQRAITFSSSACDILDTNGSVFGNIHVTDGKLDNDCLVPLFINSESATNGYTVRAFFSGSEKSPYVYQPTFTYEPGKIYVVEAGNEKWMPVTVAVPEEEVAPEVGMVIGSDGKYYAPTSELPSGVKAEAMIAYVGKVDGVCDTGLAIALEDIGSGNFTWDGNLSTDSNDGKTATEIVADWAKDHTINSDASGWRLPSAYDWQRMFIGCGADNTYTEELSDGLSFSYGELSGKLEIVDSDISHTQRYWSSTMYDSDDSHGVWAFYFSVSEFYWLAYYGTCAIRAVYAF